MKKTLLFFAGRAVIKIRNEAEFLRLNDIAKAFNCDYYEYFFCRSFEKLKDLLKLNKELRGEIFIDDFICVEYVEEKGFTYSFLYEYLAAVQRGYFEAVFDFAEIEEEVKRLKKKLA